MDSAQATPSSPCGFLNVNKPQGITSRRALDRVGKVLGKAKLGHAGTLDPLATGVLVLCVGAATRLVEHVQRLAKTYRTTILLGARSDTLDADGQIVATPGAVAPAEEQVRLAVAAQCGTIAQTPPAFSALKVAGQRAYRLARAGSAVELAARDVQIHRIEVVSYEWPRLALEIDCSSGTYIRSIARDLGEALGCGGLVETLMRTRIGPFRLEDALGIEQITAQSVLAQLRPALEAVADWPRLHLDAHELAMVLHGQPLPADTPERQALPGGPLALLDSAGALAALADHDPQTRLIHPNRVLARA
jgi:tRNA pseudouridine55 synthase